VTHDGLITPISPMTPVANDKLYTHELFCTDAARIYLGQERQLEKARATAF
jgi:hypothetical protein